MADENEDVREGTLDNDIDFVGYVVRGLTKLMDDLVSQGTVPKAEKVDGTLEGDLNLVSNDFPACSYSFRVYYELTRTGQEATN